MECLGCGACCTTQDDLGIIHTVADTRGLPDWFRKGLVERKHPEGILALGAIASAPLVPSPHGKQCAALAGEVGTTAMCRIYDDRPSVCRKFVPGDEGCLRARQRCGMTDNG